LHSPRLWLDCFPFSNLQLMSRWEQQKIWLIGQYFSCSLDENKLTNYTFYPFKSVIWMGFWTNVLMHCFCRVVYTKNWFVPHKRARSCCFSINHILIHFRKNSKNWQVMNQNVSCLRGISTTDCYFRTTSQSGLVHHRGKVLK
jgi:hypothetical protein